MNFDLFLTSLWRTAFWKICVQCIWNWYICQEYIQYMLGWPHLLLLDFHIQPRARFIRETKCFNISCSLPKVLLWFILSLWISFSPNLTYLHLWSEFLLYIYSSFSPKDNSLDFSFRILFNALFNHRVQSFVCSRQHSTNWLTCQALTVLYLIGRKQCIPTVKVNWASDEGPKEPRRNKYMDHRDSGRTLICGVLSPTSGFNFLFRKILLKEDNTTVCCICQQSGQITASST